MADALDAQLATVIAMLDAMGPEGERSGVTPSTGPDGADALPEPTSLPFYADPSIGKDEESTAPFVPLLLPEAGDAAAADAQPIAPMVEQEAASHALLTQADELPSMTPPSLPTHDGPDAITGDPAAAKPGIAPSSDTAQTTRVGTLPAPSSSAPAVRDATVHRAHDAPHFVIDPLYVGSARSMVSPLPRTLEGTRAMPFAERAATTPTRPTATPAMPSTSPSRPNVPSPAGVTTQRASAEPSRMSTVRSDAPSPRPQRMIEIRLPNGNAGRTYDVHLGSMLPDHGRIHIISPLPEGLELESSRLQGIPGQSGEHVIRWSGSDGSIEGALLLTVNPDPRSLWTHKPSDPAGPYAKPDTDSATGQSPVARVVVASVRGRSHAHVGSYRDDDFALHLPSAPHGWHVLVVADGAGSAKYSRRGSQLACEVVKANLLRVLEAPDTPDVAELCEKSLHATERDKLDSAWWSPRLYRLLVPAVAEAQAALRTEAETIGASKRDFHTTLLVAIVRKTTAGEWFVGTYWVGDGAIGMWDEAWTAPKVFGEADSGDFAGETTFLTHEDFGKPEVVNRRLRYTIVPAFSYFALMTDGVSDPKFDAETKLRAADVWRTFTADLATATEGSSLADMTETQLLKWLEFWSPGNHDDRTLLLFHPSPDRGGAV